MQTQDKTKLLAPLRVLMSNEAWLWLEEQINTQLEAKIKRLENIPDYQLDKEQGWIKGLRFPRQKLDELLKELTKGTDNATA